VDCVLPASGSAAVNVRASLPLNLGVGGGHAGALALAAPGPNPYRGGEALAVRFTLPADGPAELALFDLAGRRVATLFRGSAAAGDHAARWNGRDAGGSRAANGVYFVRLNTGSGERVRRIVVME